MNVPKLRFKEFDEELIEDIIQNYAEVQTGPFGSQLHEKDYVKVGTPIITVEHFGDNRIIHKNLPMVSNEDKERLKKYSLKEGDVVFSRVGSIDRRVYVTEREDGWLFSGRCLRLRIINTNLSSKYLSTYLGTTKCLNEIRSKAVGGTMPSLNTDILNSISINLPQYKEQEKVASFFEKLDKQIQLQQQKIDLLQEQKKGFLQKMFPKVGAVMPEIRFTGFTDDWGQRNIKEISKVFIGLVTSMTENYRDEGTLLIRNSDIKPGRLEFADNPIHLDEKFAEKNATRRLQIGDVVTVHTGDIGTSAVIGERENGAIGFATINTRPDTSVLDSAYLNNYFNTTYHKNWAIKMSTGDGRSNYNLYDFNRLMIPLPRLEEQKKIGAFINKLDDTIALHQQKLDFYKEQKKGFMQQMFI